MTNFQLPPPPFAGKITHQPSPAKTAVNVIAEDRAYRKVENVDVFECTCLRCGHVWHTLQQTKPKCCPTVKCHSSYWDRPRTNKPRLPKLDKPAKTAKIPGGKNATRKIPESGSPEGSDSITESVSPIALEVLETMGNSENKGAGTSGGVDEYFARHLSRETPVSDGTVVSPRVDGEPDTIISSGQSDDDRAGESAPNETVSALEEEDLSGADALIGEMM